MEVVELDGDARRRGRAHGEACGALIVSVLERFEAQWPVALRRELFDQGGFVAAAEREAPHLLEELRGIGDGSGAGFERILALNLMDELWPRAAAGLDHCSALGVHGGGGRPALVAQTMDLPLHYDGAQTLLRVRPAAGGPALLLLTVAGMLGLCGLNGAGVAVAVNSILQLHTSPAGLPVAFVIRRLLEQRSAAAAAALCRRVAHATGQHYLIGGPDAVVGLEASAGGVAEVPYDAAGRVCHTNHALASRDRAWRADPAGDLLLNRSGPRLERLRAGLAALDAPAAADLQRLLASRHGPISRELGDDDGGFSFAAVVMELGAEPVLHLAPGPPSKVPFAAYRFG